MAEVEDEIRYREARPGDHLCCPFQCSNCQSQNIRGRDLVINDVQDDAFDCLAIRANLDAFWSHASKTVASHRTEVKFLCKYSEALEITHPFPRLGPFPVGHHLGMLQAIMLEIRSLEPGRKGKKVTWGTTRHQRATYTVLWEASPDSGGISLCLPHLNEVDLLPPAILRKGAGFSGSPLACVHALET